MANDPSFDAALDRVKAAAAAMGSGDPEPYMDIWAERDDVTLFGAWGPIEKGAGSSRRRSAGSAAASSGGSWSRSTRSRSRAGTSATPSASSAARWPSTTARRGR